jgi:hypothetical protein
MMLNRYSRQAARDRCEPLWDFMWLSLPFGLAVFTVVNLLQIVSSWADYSHGWVALLLLAGLASVFMLIWLRSPDGIGPVLSAFALTAGPAACLIIATQLNQTTLTSPANWVSGFCIVPICLLPFSRPPEEMALGIAAIVAAQAAAMRNAGHNLRDLHSIVLSGGAGAAIGVGIMLLIAVLRRMNAIHRQQVQRALDAIRANIRDQDAAVFLTERVTAAQVAAAAMLEAVAAGDTDVAAPEVRRECQRLRAAVRSELLALGEQSLLRAELTPADGPFYWEVRDEDNLGQHFDDADRLLIVRALRSIARLVPDDISVQVQPLPNRHQAMVLVVSATVLLPDTPDWQALRRRFTVIMARGEAGRLIYSWNVPVATAFWRKDDQDSARR